MAAAITSYKQSDAFQRLAPKTQRDYDRHLERFAPYGHWPVVERAT
jgi:hypothetical protein